MRFFEFFVRRRVLTTVIALIAVILGGLAYWSMGLRRFPDIEFPMVTISTIYSGGTPEEIESEITKPIEDAVSSISGVDEIRSFSQQGVSQVIVQFELEEDIDIKAVDVRNNIDQVKRELPDGAEDPVVNKFEIGQEPVITLALTGSQGPNQLYRIAEEELQERLSQLTGVASVVLTGGEEREIQVLLDAEKLRKHKISMDQVAQALESTNLDVPAGYVTEPNQEYLVRAKGRFESVEDIEKLSVTSSSESTVEIRHLGRVEDTYADTRSKSRFDGQSAVIMSIQKQSKANDVEVADRVRAEIPKLEDMLHGDAELRVVEDQSEFVRGALQNVTTNMIIGITLTAIVLLLFTSSARATAVAAVVMPSAVVAALILLLFSGFSLNILTLLALALSVGIVVNNSILILEGAVRFMEKGKPSQEAAALGAADIALPVFSTTATNLVVFLPIAFMGEIIGRFFHEFGLTIVYVTIASLGISYTLTPMLCGLLLTQDGREWRLATLIPRIWQWFLKHVKNVYVRVVGWTVRHRISTAMLWIISLVGIGFMGTSLGGEFMPETDEGRLRASIQAPAGTPLEETDKMARKLEEAVSELPHLEHYYTRVGRVSGFMGGSNVGVNLAEIGVTVADRGERDLTLDDFLDRLRPAAARIPSAQVSLQRAGGGPGTAPVEVEIQGDDLDAIRRIALDVKDVVERAPGTTSVRKSWQSGQPELRVLPVQERIARHYLSVAKVAREVRAYVDGREVREFRDVDEDYDIRIRLQKADRERAEQVEGFFIKSPATGEMLQIGQVADLSYEPAPTLITRRDRTRYVSIQSQLTGERSQTETVEAIRQGIDEDVEVPDDVEIAYAGETELIQKNFKELYQALAIAAGLTFLAASGIIESFIFGFVIIVSVPLSLIGVIIAMLIGGVTINVFSLMAIIMLVGMVVNNAIIIIDYAERPEFADKSPAERVKNSCSARFRVILMANLTTIAAMVPLALGLGFAGEIFRPIAVVQIGGVFAAGVVSLLLIPAVYCMVMDRKERKTEARSA